jgi:hypothetical protein
VPLSEVNLLIYSNVTGNLKKNQQKVSGKGCLANFSKGMV